MIDRIFKNWKTSLVAGFLFVIPWVALFVYPEWVKVEHITAFYGVIVLGGGLFARDGVKL